jgi:uncharacterized membrane protein YdbT with pleckstrin-like domain
LPASPPFINWLVFIDASTLNVQRSTLNVQRGIMRRRRRETAFRLRSVEVVLEMIARELAKVSFDIRTTVSSQPTRFSLYRRNKREVIPLICPP